MAEAAPHPRPDALEHFRACLEAGKPWFPSLLGAIALWGQPEEVVDGQRLRYLVDGEAFDWLLLAQRLCSAVNSLIPAEEVEALLLHGRLPGEVDHHQFRRLIGPAKHRAYLNFFYGVVVEEALMGAVEEEVRKERRCTGLPEEPGLHDEVCLRIYGAAHSALLAGFRNERGYPQGPVMDLQQLKEFTYWLFKYRLKNSEPARVASDTRKGLLHLHHHRRGHPLP